MLIRFINKNYNFLRRIDLDSCSTFFLQKIYPNTVQSNFVSEGSLGLRLIRVLFH